MYTFFLNLGTIFSLIVHVRSIFHESDNLRLRDPEEVVDILNFDQEGLIAPVDRHLLQQEHLDTWRDLRTIEVVVTKNKCSWVFGKALNNVVEGILKKFNLPPEELHTLHYRAKMSGRRKKKKSLTIIVYYLTEVLKHHLSGKIDEELHSLAKRLIANYKFPPNANLPKVERELITPFMDSVMSGLGLQLLLETFGKAMIENNGVFLHSGGKLDWKKLIVREHQIQYSKHYQAYMKLIEVFDILAAAGVQDRNLISTYFTPSLERSSTKTRELLGGQATTPNQIHRYLINRTPHDQNKPLVLPIFGYPAKINEKSSAQLEMDIHRVWSLSGEKDLEISSRLLELSTKVSDTCEDLPQKVCNMGSYAALLNTAQAGSDRDVQMFNHISRTINLVIDLERDNSEEQRVLLFILESALKPLAMISDPRESERRIENSVMFYLFIRRIATVLTEITQKDSSLDVHNGNQIKAKFMMYYWSLVSYTTPGCAPRTKNTVEWMEFGLGRVYLDHLRSSVALNKLHQQMDLIAETGRTAGVPNSIQLDKLDLISDEHEPATFNSKKVPINNYSRNQNEAASTSNFPQETTPAPVKSSNEPLDNLRRNPQRSTTSRTYVLPEDKEYYENFPSSQIQATSPEKELNTNIQDRLNFKIPKWRSSRYPSLPVHKDVSEKKVERPFDQRTDDDWHESRDSIAPFAKRPRTTTYKSVLPGIPVGFVSREHEQIHPPKNEQIQTPKGHQCEAVQEGQGRQHLIHNTGSEPESSDSLSPIVSSLDKHGPPSAAEKRYVNLNDPIPMEETSHYSAPQVIAREFNHPGGSDFSDRAMRNWAFDSSKFEATSFPQQSGDGQPTVSLRTEHNMPHVGIRSEEIPDLNLPAQISPEQ